jgi:hypothetical protein
MLLSLCCDKKFHFTWTLLICLALLVCRRNGLRLKTLLYSLLIAFVRRYKTPHHPHTNMAKAALNMLTRTSAEVPHH